MPRLVLQRALIVVAIAALPVTCAYPQGKSSRESIDVQRARSKAIAERGKKAFYTQAFDISDLPQYKPDKKVAGVIRIWGLNYLADGNMAEYWEEGFRKYHPGAKIEWSLKTTLTAIPGLYTGLADIGASRHVTFDELLAFQRTVGHAPLEIVMTSGSYNVTGWQPAQGIFVHKDNPISKITFKEIDGIFGAQRTGGYQGLTWHPELGRGPEGNIRRWGQLGLTGKWRDEPIHVYGVSLKDHAQLDIERKVFNGGDKWNEDLREYSNYAKADGSLAIAARELMKDLSNDPYGMAYSVLENLTPQTKVLAVSEKDGGPYIDLTIDNVRNRSYPLLSETYWYVNRAPGRPIDPKVKEFLRYVLSREGQAELMRDGKYLPLTGEIVREQLEKLE